MAAVSDRHAAQSLKACRTALHAFHASKQPVGRALAAFMLTPCHDFKYFERVIRRGSEACVVVYFVTNQDYPEFWTSSILIRERLICIYDCGASYAHKVMAEKPSGPLFAFRMASALASRGALPITAAATAVACAC